MKARHIDLIRLAAAVIGFIVMAQALVLAQ